MALFFITLFFISGKIATSELAKQACSNATKCIWLPKPTRKLSKNITPPAQHSYASIFSQPIETFLSPAAGELEHKGRAAEAHNASSAVAGNVRCTWLPKHGRPEIEREEARALAHKLHSMFQRNNGKVNTNMAIKYKGVLLPVNLFYSSVAGLQMYYDMVSTFAQVLSNPCIITCRSIKGHLDDQSFVRIHKNSLSRHYPLRMKKLSRFAFSLGADIATSQNLPAGLEQILANNDSFILSEINDLTSEAAADGANFTDADLRALSILETGEFLPSKQVLITQEFWKRAAPKYKEDGRYLLQILLAEKMHGLSFWAFAGKRKDLPHEICERIQTFLMPTPHQLATHRALVAADLIPSELSARFNAMRL